MAQDIGFGLDTSVLSGTAQELDDTFTEMNSIQILGEDIYKACSCPSAPVVIVSNPETPDPLPLMFWENPFVSFDLRDRLNDTIGPSEAASIEGYIQAVYEQDDRFDNGVSADVTFSNGTNELRAAVQGTASGIPLALVLTADSNQVRFEAA